MFFLEYVPKQREIKLYSLFVNTPRLRMEDKVSQTFYRLYLTVYSCLEESFLMLKFKLIKI